MRRLLAACLLTLYAAGLAAMPEPIRPDEAGWKALGRGEMRWFGLRLYDAELWVKGAGWTPEGSFALRLTYAKSIAGARIVEASVEEMRRLGWRDETQLGRWREEMSAAFPDVEPGNSLTGLALPGQGVQFWLGGRLRHVVRDPEFARAFFAIWLDPRTREPALRRRLLGLVE